MISEPLPLKIQLGAATNHVRASLVDFSVSFDENVHHMDHGDAVTVDLRMTYLDNAKCDVIAMFHDEVAQVSNLGGLPLQYLLHALFL